MFSFGIKTMGWKNFGLQVLVRCPSALCCNLFLIRRGRRLCRWIFESRTRNNFFKKSSMQPSVLWRVLFWDRWLWFVVLGFLCRCFLPQLTMFGLGRIFISWVFLYVCVYYTLFFSTCISIIFNFCNGWDVCMAIWTPLSELLVSPDHSSAFIKAVMIWEHESLFQIQQQF